MRATPILTFHDLADDHANLAFPLALFASLLDQIERAGWQTVSLLDWVDQPSADSTPQVLLTFDDGYRSVYEIAFPMLAARGMVATVFVTPSADRRLPPMNGRERLSWAEMQEMHAHGISFGAHTCTHPDLTTLSDTAIRAEMRDSQAMLQDRLGAPVRSFAYPFGRYDVRCIAAAREFFDCAVTADLALASHISDPYALPRVETHYFRHPRLLPLLTGGSMPAYLWLRRVPRAVRQRVIGHQG